MSWGAKLIGFNAVMDMFDSIQTRIEGNAVYVVGTNVEYAVWVETGTTKMEAQPYLRPAMNEADRNIKSIVGDAGSTNEAVKRVALFIERKAAENAPVDTGNLQASIRTERVR